MEKLHLGADSDSSPQKSPPGPPSASCGLVSVRPLRREPGHLFGLFCFRNLQILTQDHPGEQHWLFGWFFLLSIVSGFELLNASVSRMLGLPCPVYRVLVMGPGLSAC